MARQRTPDGPPPPPAVQKLRVRYARRGRMRFTSTRDVARALERALRRAQVPMAFTAGFHPHPRISYAGGAPTGTASEAEYLEISLAERRVPESIRVALDAALPPGLDVVEVVEALPGALAERLQASHWRLEMRQVPAGSAALRDLHEAVTAYLGSPVVEVTRTFKTGPKTFDTRAAVLDVALTPPEGEGCAILDVVVRHTTPTVRPDDILTALRAVSGFCPPAPPLVTRLAQGPLTGSGAQVADPLAAEKDAAGP